MEIEKQNRLLITCYHPITRVHGYGTASVRINHQLLQDVREYHCENGMRTDEEIEASLERTKKFTKSVKG